MSLARDEQNVQPGELAYCDGVEVNGGALRPTVLTGTDIEHALLDKDGTPLKLVYVHVTSVYTHYICHRETGQHTFAWFDKTGKFGGDILHDADSINKIESIGNTLVFIEANGTIGYCLYCDGKYKWLGNKPPFLTLYFKLRDCGPEKYEHGNIEIKNPKGLPTEWALQGTRLNYYEVFDDKDKPFKDIGDERGGKYENIKPEKRSDITESVWALLNRTNNLIASKGHFYANFFVRYCYRMYDGTMIMHSAPIFEPVLLPDNFQVWNLNILRNKDKSAYYLKSGDKIILHTDKKQTNNLIIKSDWLTFFYHPRNVALQYKISDSNGLYQLKNWEDIITSVDIFVTPPLTRDKTGEIIKAIGPERSREYTDRGDFFYPYYANDFLGLWGYMFGKRGTPTQDTMTSAYLPTMTDKEYAEFIENQPAFFKIASIDLKDIKISSEYKDVDLGNQSLVNLTTFEQMKDDYKTHNVLQAGGSYVYNHKLHLFDVRENLFEGFDGGQLWGNEMDNSIGVNNDYNPIVTIDQITVRVRTDDGLQYKSVRSSALATIYYITHIPVFYPDARADKMYVHYTKGYGGANKGWIIIPLKECRELNGAMHVAVSPHICDAIGDLADCQLSSTGPDADTGTAVHYPSKIYASSMKNPFYFPAEGIITVGTGAVRGMASATRALSQGQFGQYPLMAFTSDGIWALSVASDGNYSTVRPISREVCDNVDSICQIDQSVVFATKRGINKIAEINVASFSDILDGPYFSLDRLNRIADIKQNYKAVGDTVYLREPGYYYKNASVRYDYCNGRLLLIPHSAPGENIKIYVYSITDDAWSTFSAETPLAVLNGYPYLYWQESDGKVKVLDRPYSYENGKVYSGMILTRTLTYSAAMSSIGGFDQQTDSARRQTLFVWGSNDNRTWHYVGMSSRMHADYIAEHPFRYFRLMIITELTEADKYYDITLDVKSKYAKI